MPRAGTGACTAPAGQPVVAGTVISDVVFNALVTDIYTILTDSLSRTGSGSMSVPLGNPDGLVGSPGIMFTNEAGSGLYRAGANDIRMSIAGVDRCKWTAAGLEAAAADIALIDRAGTIGIGTTSGTTITIGRAGQALSQPGNVTVGGTLGVTGTADIATIDRSGTIDIGATNGTTITVGRSGQTLSLPGTVDAGTVISSTPESTTLTLGTDWSVVTVNAVRRSAGVVCVSLSVTATVGGASFTSLATLPVGYRPGVAFYALGAVQDATAGPAIYPAMYVVNPDGTIVCSHYDNGTSYITPVFAIGTGDRCYLQFTFIVGI